MDEIRTLCFHCFHNYDDAGFLLRLNGVQFFKGSCDLCGRPGWEYIVRKKSAARKDGLYEFYK